MMKFNSVDILVMQGSKFREYHMFGIVPRPVAQLGSTDNSNIPIFSTF